MVGVERSAGLELSGAGLALPLCDLSIDSVYIDRQPRPSQPQSPTMDNPASAALGLVHRQRLHRQTTSTLTITASDSLRVRPWTTLPLPLWDLSIDSVYIDRQPRPSRLLTPTESDHGQPGLGLTAAMCTAYFYSYLLFREQPSVL